MEPERLAVNKIIKNLRFLQRVNGFLQLLDLMRDPIDLNLALVQMQLGSAHLLFEIVAILLVRFRVLVGLLT